MADPTFSQSERRNLVLPVALAAALFAAAAYLVLRCTPHRTADLAITHTATWQAHTVFKSDSIVVGRDQAQDDLYVLATLRIDDRLKLPLFLKDITATLTTADGGTLDASAVEKPELEPLYTTFPALRRLASAPLLRDAEVAPGQSAEGMVLLRVPVTQEIWDHRKSAILTVALYHQPPQTVTLPKP